MNLFFAPDGRLRAIWRFVIGVLVIVAANVLAGAFASAFGAGRLFDLVYRPLLMALLFAGFVLLLIFLDRAESPIDALGLSTRAPWLRQSVIGIALGGAMV